MAHSEPPNTRSRKDVDYGQVADGEHIDLSGEFSASELTVLTENHDDNRINRKDRPPSDRKMKSFTIQRLGRIKNEWIRDALSEILSTFMLALFVYASGAQDVLTRGAGSSPPGRALTAGVGLMMAVYCGYNASGPCVNPSVALMFCMTGYLKWKKWLFFSICELLGCILAATLTYGIYLDMINMYDGGERAVYGVNATAHIFTSFPRAGITKTTGFFDIAVGCGLLTSCTFMLVDKNNANTMHTKGLVPLSLAVMLYGIIMSFGVNTGAPINFTIDLGGRIFTSIVGYGSDVFTRDNYWFWIPPLACLTGTILFTSAYMLMIGNHLPENTEDESEEPVPEVSEAAKYKQRMAASNDDRL